MSFPIPFYKNHGGSRHKKKNDSGVGENSFDHEPIKSEIQLQLTFENSRSRINNNSFRKRQRITKREFIFYSPENKKTPTLPYAFQLLE